MLIAAAARRAACSDSAVARAFKPSMTASISRAPSRSCSSSFASSRRRYVSSRSRTASSRDRSLRSASASRRPLARRRRGAPARDDGRPRRRARVLGQLLLAVAQVLARRGNDRWRHAQPRGDLDGQAAPRRAVHQTIGRRERLRIEAERRAVDALRRRGVRLQRVVVRRGDEVRAARAEVIDDGGAERAAFDRIGAGADFVQQHERRQRQVRGPSTTTFVMCAENVLRLAEIDCSSPMSAKSDLKTGSFDPGAAGTCSPACAIAAKSPAVFSATVLPPVFGPVMTSTRVGGGMQDVHRDRVGVFRTVVRRSDPRHQQRMTRGHAARTRRLRRSPARRRRP